MISVVVLRCNRDLSWFFLGVPKKGGSHVPSTWPLKWKCPDDNPSKKRRFQGVNWEPTTPTSPTNRDHPYEKSQFWKIQLEIPLKTYIGSHWTIRIDPLNFHNCSYWMSSMSTWDEHQPTVDPPATRGSNHVGMIQNMTYAIIVTICMYTYIHDSEYKSIYIYISWITETSASRWHVLFEEDQPPNHVNMESRMLQTIRNYQSLQSICGLSIILSTGIPYKRQLGRGLVWTYL